jgi:hypothetical protein
METVTIDSRVFMHQPHTLDACSMRMNTCCESVVDNQDCRMESVPINFSSGTRAGGKIFRASTFRALSR